MIATSLALALGVSVGMAQPSITYSQNGIYNNTNLDSPSGWSWNTGSGQNPYDNFWMPVISPGVDNIIENFTFHFDVDPTNNAQQQVSGKNLTITADGRIKGNQNTILTLNNTSTGKGIVLNSGNGNFIFDFAPAIEANNWNPTTKARKMVLNLTNTTSYKGKNVSLIGHITVKAGRPQGWFGENQFEATFGGDMIGNITVQSGVGSTSKKTYTDITTTFTFKNTASLEGNITTSQGKNTFKFFSGNITQKVAVSNNATNNLFFTSGGVLGDVESKGGTNNIVSNATTWSANLASHASGGLSGKNTLNLSSTGNSVSLGTEGAKVNISLHSSGDGQAWGSTSANLILLNGSTSSSAYIGTMNASGNYGSGAPAKNYNILSFNGTANTLSIDGLSATYGTNIIGKEFLEENASNFKIVKLSNQAVADDTQGKIFDKNGGFIANAMLDATYAATFQTLSINGAITANTGGTNLINTTNDISVANAILANGGNNYINAGNINATGTITAQFEGNNRITSSGKITLASLVAEKGYNYIKAEELELTQDSISGIGGGNKIALKNTNKAISIAKEITVRSSGGYSAQNSLVLDTQKDVTLGTQEKGINISINPSADGNGNWSSSATNLILLNGTTTSKAYISSMSVNGNYGNGVASQNLNILSFNATTGNVLEIGNVTAQFGANIIGKAYLTTDSNGFAILNEKATGATTTGKLFDSNGAYIAANLMGSDNAAGFTTLSIKGAITANQSGANFINTTNDLEIGQNINANQGNNYISAGNITATGTITAQAGGNNQITSSGKVTLASLVADKGYNYIKAKELELTQNSISGIGGGNKITLRNDSADINIAKEITIRSAGGISGQNTLALNAANVTLGETSQRINLTITGSSDGNAAWSSTASNLVLLNGTTTSKAYIDSMSANGNYGGSAPSQSYNILSFNGTSSNQNTLIVGDITSTFGTNVIGKGYLEADTNGFAKIKKTTKQTPEGETVIDTDKSLFDNNGSFILANFMQADNAASFESLSVDGAITANKGGSNFINTTNVLNIGTNVLANNGNNYISAGNITATGTITAQAGGNNQITSSGKVTLASLVANGGYNYIKAQELELTQDSISGVSGGNKITLTNTGKDINIAKEIAIRSAGGASGQNTLALNANNVTLGTDEANRIGLTIRGSSDGNAAWSSTASNLILLNGTTTSKAYIASMIADGNYGGGAGAKNYNILSFNGTGSNKNTLIVGDITSNFGANVIGKNYLAADSDGYVALNNQATDSTEGKLFDKNGALIVANLMTSANAASFESLSVDGAITANKGGNNFINTANALSIQKQVVADQGNNYFSAGSITFASLEARSGGVNQAVLTGAEVSTLGNIKAYAGKNVIHLSHTGTTKTADGNTDGITISAKASGAAVGQNIINFDQSTSNTLTIASITLDNDNTNNNSSQSAANYLNLTGTGNNLTIGSMDAGSKNSQNVNVLAKNILEGSSASEFRYKTGMTTDTYMADTNAFEGTLKITDGIFGAKGTNIISYKATDSATSTIIGADTTNNTAISGNASVYLDISNSGISNGVDAISTYLQNVQDASAYTTLESKAVIAGNIIGSGSTNIKIIGKANEQAGAGVPGAGVLPYSTVTNNSQIGILGNINNQGGTTNIVLVDSFFAPSEMIVNGGNPYGVTPSSLTAPTIVGGERAGNITTASGAVTNIVTRFTDKSLAGSGYSLYTINNQGSGKTNIVLQGDYQIGANVNYGGSYDGQVNMIFASASNITTTPLVDGDGKVSSDTFATQMDDPTQAGTQMCSSTDASANRILGVTYEKGLKLTLQDRSVKVGDGNASFVNTYGRYFTATNHGKVSTFTLDRTSGTDTINIRGLVLGTISPLADSTSVLPGSPKSYNVSIAENSAYVGNVALEANASVSLTMNQGSKLLTDSDVFYVKKLTLGDGKSGESATEKSIQFDATALNLNTFAQNNTIIDIATMGSDLGNVEQGRENFRLFAVGASASGTDTGLQGQNALFRVYVNDKASQTEATKLGGQAVSEQNGYFYADRVVIADIGQISTQQNAQTHYLQVIADGKTDLGSIHYDNAQTGGTGTQGGTAIKGNIAVATVKNDTTNIAQTADNSTQAIVVFKAQDVIQGFDQVATTLTAKETDEHGMTGGTNGWTTYFVDSMRTKGATSERGELSAATLATNYDLYMANFNSLNKRMGELRDNDNSQGAWARVFNGAQTNTMGLGTKSNYTTFQGGYDYAFGFEGANNYLGVALSYSMSSSEIQSTLQQAIDRQSIGFDNVKSSAVEVAIYNAYVQDEGWYNDSIFKFSYIMSDFNILGQNTTYNTNNMAFTLSDEFGYRFKLGESKEWYIDPQLEVSFGYFDQSELKQTLGDAWLNTIADSVMTLRARAGSSFAYDFKNFTQGKGINASVYVGAFYEYDYVSGGDITLTTNLGGETTNSSALSSDGRVVMNVGTNMTIKDNTRIYFDFEKSFVGKITTDYQVNVGVRYSFGENASYIPSNGAKKEIAPLKVSDENATQEDKEVQSSEATSQETQSTQEQSNAENKVEEKTQSQDSKEQNAESKVEEKKDAKEEAK